MSLIIPDGYHHRRPVINRGPLSSKWLFVVNTQNNTAKQQNPTTDHHTYLYLRTLFPLYFFFIALCELKRSWSVRCAYAAQIFRSQLTEHTHSPEVYDPFDYWKRLNRSRLVFLCFCKNMDNMSDLSSGLSSAAVDTGLSNNVINPTKKYYRKTAHRYVLCIQLWRLLFDFVTVVMIDNSICSGIVVLMFPLSLDAQLCLSRKFPSEHSVSCSMFIV